MDKEECEKKNIRWRISYVFKREGAMKNIQCEELEKQERL